MRITSLRQYPAGNHDRPLTHLAEREDIEFERRQYTATSNLAGAPRNAVFFLRALTVSRGERVVLGAEPFDPRIVAFERLTDRHHVILHSSWPFWDGGFVPQPTRFDRIRREWYDFVESLTAVCPTRAATDALAEHGVNAYHIPHAVDTNVFHPEADDGRRADGETNGDSEWNGSTSAESDTSTILFAGKLEKRKGVAELLRVAENWSGPQSEFRFAGDGPLAEAVRDSPAATHLGYLGNHRLAAEYAAADVFVLPSFRVDGWEELFGVVIIEAFASGTPVVATDCVGPAELVEDGETGYVVSQHDTSAFADRIEGLLVDSDERARMARTARKRATERFDLDIVADQWLDVLGTVRS